MQTQKEFHLFISANDVIVKIYFNFLGFKGGKLSFGITWGPKLIKVVAYDLNTNDKLTTQLITDNGRNKIKIGWSKVLLPNYSPSCCVDLYLHPSTIQRIGKLNILEWPQEMLSKIIFSPDAGNIIFSSAFAPIMEDPRTNNKIIIPNQLTTQLHSHIIKGRSGIRLEWGIPPTIQMQFIYQLYNQGNTPVYNIKINANVYPTTNFQHTTLITNISETNDADGNLNVLLQIPKMEPNSTIETRLHLKIDPQGNFTRGNIFFGTWEDYERITTSGMWGELFLKSSKYWPISDPIIQNSVQFLRKNAPTASDYIIKTFEFVNSRMTYEKNGIRESASNTIRTMKGDCSEFSDLFICLLRAAGIPAKLIVGDIIDLFNRDLSGHAWVEIYSPKMGWVQSDPTWGFLAGVSCQHLARQREGIILEQSNFRVRWKSDFKNQQIQQNQLLIKEKREIRRIS